MSGKMSPETRIIADPIEFPHRYQEPKDIEIAAFIAAVLAYGRVSLFKQTIEKILRLTYGRPYDYLINFDRVVERPRFEGIYYRFSKTDDLFFLVHLLRRVILQYGSLGRLFASLYHEEEDDLRPTLIRFVTVLRKYHLRSLTPGLLHLLPSPEKGGACKRLNLFLRWMIRPDDGIDFGLWKNIPPGKLVIPLDTHVIRISHYLGFTKRKSIDWKMAQEITGVLRQIDPSDPLKYDFFLCHLGISEACPMKGNPRKCQDCALLPACGRGKELVRKQAN